MSERRGDKTWAFEASVKRAVASAPPATVARATVALCEELTDQYGHLGIVAVPRSTPGDAEAVDDRGVRRPADRRGDNDAVDQ